MMFILGYLAESGRANAKAALLQLANDGDVNTSVRALYILGPSDPAGEFRDLYMRKATDGNVAAFQLLSLSADSGLVEFMKMRQARPLDGSNFAYEAKASAQEALERYEILMSTDWQLKLGDVILEEKPFQVQWAITAAQRNSLPGLDLILRKRLDMTTQSMKLLHDRIESSADPGTPKRSFESLYTTEGWLSGMPVYFDDMLISQQARGGKLTDLESARLRTFGYGVDPKTRLCELVSTGK